MGNFYLGVWHSRTAVSDDEARRQYSLLGAATSPFREFDSLVYAFYFRLTELYPEIDMVPESDIDASPWACAMDMSGGYVIMAIRPEEAEAFVPDGLTLADQHELVCFDPQAGKVHLPPHLRAREASAAE